MEHIQVFTTTENEDDARRIAKDLVEKRLVACAQVIGPIGSTYRWKGKIEEEQEWLCILKSRYDRYEKLEKKKPAGGAGIGCGRRHADDRGRTSDG